MIRTISKYFIPPTPNPNVLGVRSIDQIGVYFADQIKIVSVPPYNSPFVSYSEKISDYILNWGESLSSEERKQLKIAINNEFGVLISILETLFSTSQNAASALYKSYVPPSSTPPYVPVGWSSTIATGIQDITLTLSNAVELYIIEKYATKGL